MEASAAAVALGVHKQRLDDQKEDIRSLQETKADKTDMEYVKAELTTIKRLLVGVAIAATGAFITFTIAIAEKAFG